MKEDDLYENIPDDELFCDVCGMTYKEFLKTGIFGCENCYRVFKSKTVQMIKNQLIDNNVKEKKIVVKSNFVSNSKKSVKERIKELEKLLELSKKFDDKEKIVLIEKELEELRKIEKER